jgi:Protein of unknown function (DUF2628)
MASYTVHLPPGGADRFDKARFLRDGFSWMGFSYGPLWLLSQGAWIAGLIMLGAHVGLALLVFLCGLSAFVGALGFSLLQLLIGLEGASMIRWQLDLKGWREAGLVTGNDLDALEQRFFAEAMPEAEAATSLPNSHRATVPTVLGLFPQHGGGHR